MNINKEETKSETVKDKEVIVFGIDIETAYNNQNVVNRVRFLVSSNGLDYISWKPKTTTELYRDGFKIIRAVPCEIDRLPQKLKAIANELQTYGGIARYKVSYQTLVKDDKEYSFINSEKWLDKWVFLGRALPQKAIDDLEFKGA